MLGDVAIARWPRDLLNGHHEAFTDKMASVGIEPTTLITAKRVYCFYLRLFVWEEGVVHAECELLHGSLDLAQLGCLRNGCLSCLIALLLERIEFGFCCVQLGLGSLESGLQRHAPLATYGLHRLDGAVTFAAQSA